MRTAIIMISAFSAGWTTKAALTAHVRGPFQPEKSFLPWLEQPAVSAFVTILFLITLVLALLWDSTGRDNKK